MASIGDESTIYKHKAEYLLMGYKLIEDTPGEVTSPFTLDLYESIKFELFLLLTYLLAQLYSMRLTNMKDYLNKNFLKVELVRNYETVDEEEDKAGKEEKFTTEFENTVKQTAEDEYENRMSALCKELPRNYIESNRFCSLQQISLTVLVVFQLMQAMCFNSIIDIPVLLLILLS